MILIIWANYMGVCGDWVDYTFGVRLINHWDPMGCYIAGGIDLFGDGKYSPWWGHPGLTLMLLIHIVARVGHFFHSVMDGSAPFAIYAAKNIRWIVFFSKTLIACLTLLSFYILFFVSFIITKNRIISILAVITYATTFPVMYYADRISTETLLIIFTLLTFFFIWKHLENVGKKDTSNALLFIGLASLSSVSAVYSKLSLSYPLIPFTILYIFTGKNDTLKNENYKSRMKYLSAGIYISLSFLFFLLGAQKTDWITFLAVWKDFIPVKRDFISISNGITWESLQEIFSFLFSNLLNITSDHRKDPLLLAAIYRKYLFLFVEFFLIISTALGVGLFYKKYPENRNRLIYIFIYIFLLLPPILYNPLFHYLIILLPFAAIFSAFFFYSVVNKFVNEKVSCKAKFYLSFLIIILVQQISIAFAVDTRINDYRNYKKWRGYYDALDRIEYGEKIGIVNQFPHTFRALHGAGGLPDTTRFIRALKKHVIILDANKKYSMDFIRENKISLIVALTKDGYEIQFVD